MACRPPWTKPLERQLWFAPHDDVNVWVESVHKDEFLAELGLSNTYGNIVVASSHETESSKFRSSVLVKTALVSPKTAAALTRALQTIKNNYDYRIPTDGDELEINNPPYKLTGWLVNGEYEFGIDEKDPLRYDVKAIECTPSSKTIRDLNLIFTNDIQPKWIDASHGNTVFVYEAWGDDCEAEREDRRRYDEAIRSSGWRLRIKKEVLADFLNGIGLDLMVEIEITRRNRGYGYDRRYDEEEDKEARFDRVILLRKDGTIEAAEGCIGTWTVSGS